MNLNQFQKRDLLAGEYVLGTLRGSARRRFERELKRSPLLRAEVEVWEESLAPWWEHLVPERPAQQVWVRIEKQLGKKDSPAFWHSLKFWRSIGVMATAAAVLFVVYVGTHFEMFFPKIPTYVAMLSGKGADPQFLIQIYKDKSELEAMVLKPMDIPPTQDCELWMLSAQGQAPVSLGLLPISGMRKLRLNPEVLAALTKAQGLAVSLEPSGGSKTGAPTGPVMFQGALTSLL